jgi:hypothetical protein
MTQLFWATDIAWVDADAHASRHETLPDVSTSDDALAALDAWAAAHGVALTDGYASANGATRSWDLRDRRTGVMVGAAAMACEMVGEVFAR